MRCLFTAATAIAALGGCATMLTPSGSAADRWAALEKARAAKAESVSGDQKICKTMSVMGSNLPKKVCSTQDEWAAFNERERAKVDQFDADRRAGSTDSGFERGQR